MRGEQFVTEGWLADLKEQAAKMTDQSELQRLYDGLEALSERYWAAKAVVWNRALELGFQIEDEWGLTASVARIAAGTLSPKVVAKFPGKSSLHAVLSERVPVEKQYELAVTTIEMIDDSDWNVIHELPLHAVPHDRLRQVVGEDGEPVAAKRQRALRRKRGKQKPEPKAKANHWWIDFEKRIAKLGPSAGSLAELLVLLSAESGPNVSVENLPKAEIAEIKAKLHVDQMKDFLAACEADKVSQDEQVRRCLMAFGVIRSLIRPHSDAKRSG